MDKILLIIKREYLTRVRKKSFLILTIVGPILMAGVVLLPALLMVYSEEKKMLVEVIDNSYIYDDAFVDNDNYTFLYGQRNLDSVKADLNNNKINAIVYIPMPDTVGLACSGATPKVATDSFIYTKDGVSMEFTSYVDRAMEREAENLKLMMKGVDPAVVESAKTRINSNTLMVDEQGNENVDAVEFKFTVGMFAGLVIYMLVLLFGSAVMSGVNEEKQGRVVEVIISSVKPFQLMMGKIIGVGLVGITQFALWILLSMGLIFGFGTFMASKTTEHVISKTQIVNSGVRTLDSGNMTIMPNGMNGETIVKQEEQLDFMQGVMDSLNSINFISLISLFLFYFLFGYLMYSALFAAVGAAVDSQSEMQQFSMPITIPLIISIVCISIIVNNPGSILAMILSFFPLTSPVIMMARIPFGVPIWEIAVSMVCLIVGFVFTTWIAGKIYKTGLLMYGKKITWSELLKWLRY